MQATNLFETDKKFMSNWIEDEVQKSESREETNEREDWQDEKERMRREKNT